MLLSSLLLASPLAFQSPAAHAPEVVRGLRKAEPGASPGFVLFAPLRSRTTFLIDAKGETVHTWESPHPPLQVHLLDDGSLLRGARIDDNPTFHGGGLGGRIQRLAKDGSVTWEYVLSDAKNSLHHGYELMPNGNILCIAWEHLTNDEAIALGRDPESLGEDGFWPDRILEIKPTPPSEGNTTGGEVVWEWRAVDHLIQDFDPAKPNHGSVSEHPERIDVNAGRRRSAPPLTAEQRAEQEAREAEMRALGYAGDDDEDAADAPGSAPPDERKRADWLHTNSVDYQPATDLILLSGPELCEIWIIDHSTTTAEARGSTGGRWKKGGDLLYRWGNPAMYGAGTPADRQLFYQHQPEWVPPGLPGAGNVTVFNNGKERAPKEFSSVDELVLPFDPARGFVREPGKPFGPAQPTWSYSDPETFFSFFISGCQRLPNGNTFVCSGKQGRFFEVTPSREIVWEFWNPHGGELEMGMGRAAARARRRAQGGPPPDGAPPGERPPGDAQGAGAPPPNPVEPTSCFRATKILPDHPGLKALGVLQ